MFNPKRARALIEQQGRTTKWVAGEVGIGVKSLTYILNGRKPSRPVVILLAHVLGTTVEYLNTAEPGGT